MAWGGCKTVSKLIQVSSVCCGTAAPGCRFWEHTWIQNWPKPRLQSLTNSSACTFPFSLVQPRDFCVSIRILIQAQCRHRSNPVPAQTECQRGNYTSAAPALPCPSQGEAEHSTPKPVRSPQVTATTPAFSSQRDNVKACYFPKSGEPPSSYLPIHTNTSTNSSALWTSP